MEVEQATTLASSAAPTHMGQLVHKAVKTDRSKLD